MKGRVVFGRSKMPQQTRSSVVTIGVFDGVHIAHQRLTALAVYEAKRRGIPSIALTFDRNPKHLLAPERAQPALMPLEEKCRLLQACGLDWVWVISFTHAFSRLSAEQFIRKLLVGRLGAQLAIVGERFAFGRGRTGSADVLKTLGKHQHLQVRAVAPILRGNRPVSSSRIRQLIREGRLTDASRLLGRAPALYGPVIRGQGRGRTLGFPTANIKLGAQILPPHGVYAAYLNVSDRTYPAVMNFGTRPTFGANATPVCEVHALRFSGASLLGKTVSVSLVKKLRNEKRFPSPKELKRQIRRDITCTRTLFASTTL